MNLTAPSASPTQAPTLCTDVPGQECGSEDYCSGEGDVQLGAACVIRNSTVESIVIGIGLVVDNIAAINLQQCNFKASVRLIPFRVATSQTFDNSSQAMATCVHPRHSVDEAEWGICSKDCFQDALPLDSSEIEALNLDITNSASEGTVIATDVESLKEEGWEFKGINNYTDIVSALSFRGSFFDFAVQTNVYPFNSQPLFFDVLGRGYTYKNVVFCIAPQMTAFHVPMASWQSERYDSKLSMHAALQTVGTLPRSGIDNIWVEPVNINYPDVEYSTQSAGIRFTVIYNPPTIIAVMPLLPFLAVATTSTVMWASGHEAAASKLVPAVLLLGSTISAWVSGRASLPFQNEGLTIVDCTAMVTLLLVMYLAVSQGVTAAMLESPSMREKTRRYYSHFRGLFFLLFLLYFPPAFFTTDETTGISQRNWDRGYAYVLLVIVLSVLISFPVSNWKDCRQKKRKAAETESMRAQCNSLDLKTHRDWTRDQVRTWIVYSSHTKATGASDDQLIEIGDKCRTADIDGAILTSMVDVEILLRHVSLSLGQAVALTLAVATAFHPNATQSELSNLKIQPYMLRRVADDRDKIDEKAEQIEIESTQNMSLQQPKRAADVDGVDGVSEKQRDTHDSAAIENI